MNKEEPKKEVVVSPNPKGLTPQEIKEDTRGGVKDDLAKAKFKKDEELVKKDVEEKTRVEVLDDPTIYARLVRIERMLEWLIVQRVTDDQKLIKQPNISDIFEEIASKMDDKKTCASSG